jgi:hypothetical protein
MAFLEKLKNNQDEPKARPEKAEIKQKPKTIGKPPKDSWR